jgi:hypothetical protein
LLALSALFCLAVLGQITTGSLSAIVVDKSGSVVPKARVTMTNEASGDIRRTTTNDEGYFSILGVQAGTYSVTVEAAGFATWKAERVTFNVGDKRTLPNIELEVGTTGTEIRVTDSLEELTPVDSGEKAIVINQKQLQNVAVVGRSAAEFIKILPGFAPISPGVENRPGFNGEVIGINGNGDGGKQSALGTFSANGTRPEALDITADGAHVSDPGCNCATPVNPNPDMIAEFKVQTSNFSAENSKGPVVMSSVTKSGGKEFHGTAYFNARHFNLNANDWLLNSRKIEQPQNYYFFPGGNIGGPVLIPGTNFNKNRDKLFFFAGFEYFRQRIDTGLLQSIVPTQAMKQGDFSSIPRGLVADRASAPLNAADFPGGRIPASQLDPGMRAIMNLMPSPNVDPAGIGQGYNWAQVLLLDQNMTQFSTKVDYNINDNTKLFVRYNRQNENQPFPIQLWWRNAGAIPLPTPIIGKNRSDAISGNFTKVIDPTTTNEFVFGYTFVDFPNQYEDYNKMRRTTVGFPYRGIFKQDDKIPGFVTWGAPVASMWLTGGFDPVLFATKHLWTVSDNFSKVVGTHTMKFGGYFGYIVNKQPGNEPSAGVMQFDTWHANSTGNVLADMARGLPAAYNEQTLQANRNIGFGELAFYAQDNWKVNRRLTLEYGMRFQRIQPWQARNGIGLAAWVQSAYRPNATSSDFPGIRWNKIDSSVPVGGWPTRALFYAPRVGGAFDLFGNGKTILRGGWGRFYYHDPQLAAETIDLPAGVRSTSACCGNSLREIDAIQTQGALVFSGSAVSRNDDRQPNTDSWSATISQRLPGRQLMEVSYVGNRSRNLINQGTLRDINLVPLGAALGRVDNDGFDVNTLRPYPQYQSLNVYDHTFRANYNALQATFAKQTGRVNYTVAYTWSKAMGIVGNVLDALKLDNNYGPLSFDRTHLFTSSYVINLPDAIKGGGNKLAKGALNGWQLSGIVQLSSGVNLQQNGGNGINFNMSAPISRTDSRAIDGTRLLGTNAIQAMPLITCDPRSGLSDGQFINGRCFAPPILGQGNRPGTNGSLIMPLMRGPGFFNTDLSLFKNFKISEKKNMQFRASAYNFPNHPVRSFINGDPNLFLNFNGAGQVTNQRFGFADQRVGRRVIQLTAKFFF